MKYFSGKVVLLISPERWDHLFISKHHYAIELSKGNTVYFLNPPSSYTAVSRTNYQNIFVVDYTPFLPGLRFLPAYLQLYIFKLKFRQLEKLTGTCFDCVWSFDNSVFFDFNFLTNDTLAICHIVDYSQDFQFERAALSADICFGVSPAIVQKLRTYNVNAHHIPHGISISEVKSSTIQFPGEGQYKAMYAGNLASPYLDLSLLDLIIDQHPEVDFYFCGTGVLNLKKRANIFNLGRIEHDQLLGYLEASDVLLLVYDVDRYPLQLTNAHKVLEYLYSGTVTCSTRLTDYSSKDDILCMSSRDDFPKMFSEVINQLTKYNSPEKRKIRKQYALENSYEIRLSEIDEFVTQIGY